MLERNFVELMILNVFQLYLQRPNLVEMGILDEETEAALRSAAYEKQAKKNPAIRLESRRRVRRRQIGTRIKEAPQLEYIPPPYLYERRQSLRSYRFDVPRRYAYDVNVCLEKLAPTVECLIKGELEREDGIKVDIIRYDRSTQSV